MLLGLTVTPVADIEVLRSYLSGNLGPDGELRRTLDAAVAQCSTHTRRTIGQVEQTSVTRWVTGAVVRVPDVRVLSGVEVLDGPYAGPIEPELVEPMWTFPHPWVRLPVRLSRARVRVTGAFGLFPIPDDLLDSIYIMASRKWRERDASFADTVVLENGDQAAYYRQLPASVKATWDAYTVPRRPVVSVTVRPG